MVKRQYKQATLKQLINWAAEAQLVAQDWRQDSWQDYEFRDGKQWTQSDLARMEKLGIRALTINRTFPVLNMLQGQYLLSPSMIVAKGRTKQDNELGNVMSEALVFVSDQCQGPLHKKRAFEQAITAGIGFLETGYNTDPRMEKVCFFPRNWYSVWWDPYSTPWLPKNSCRYAFTAEWVNLDDVIMLFPEKEKEIRDQFQRLSVDDFVPDILDEGTQIEEMRRYIGSSSWVNSTTNRVRPIEMWYTVVNKCFFAKLPNQQVIDLDTLKSPNEEYQVIQWLLRLFRLMLRKCALRHSLEQHYYKMCRLRTLTTIIPMFLMLVIWIGMISLSEFLGKLKNKTLKLINAVPWPSR